jgi:hypothetical protein
MVTELCSYPFSSYPVFIGQVKAPKWLDFNCQAEQILREGAKRNTECDVAIYLARELRGVGSLSMLAISSLTISIFKRNISIEDFKKTL